MVVVVAVSGEFCEAPFVVGADIGVEFALMASSRNSQKRFASVIAFPELFSSFANRANRQSLHQGLGYVTEPTACKQLAKAVALQAA